jgi:hypothetical protein
MDQVGMGQVRRSRIVSCKLPPTCRGSTHSALGLCGLDLVDDKLERGIVVGLKRRILGP